MPAAAEPVIEFSGFTALGMESLIEQTVTSVGNEDYWVPIGVRPDSDETEAAPPAPAPTGVRPTDPAARKAGSTRHQDGQ